MTPEELKKAGYRLIVWNHIVPEYWKSFGQDPDDMDRRVGVRFGEWKGEPFTALLILKSSMRYLKHIQTVEQLEQLYRLLRSQPHDNLHERMWGVYLHLQDLIRGYYNLPGLLTSLGHEDLIEQWSTLNDKISRIVGDAARELDRQVRERGGEWET